jgi:hypothetical protein
MPQVPQTFETTWKLEIKLAEKCLDRQAGGSRAAGA